jgi:hypothetical protein
MSRSHRKRPFSGITTSDTEKQDKHIGNRKLRRKVRVRLSVDAEPETLPHVREVSDPRGMAKDGKMRFDPDRHPSCCGNESALAGRARRRCGSRADADPRAVPGARGGADRGVRERGGQRQCISSMGRSSSGFCGGRSRLGCGDALASFAHSNADDALLREARTAMRNVLED